MTRFEIWSLTLTAIYDGLTFLLLLFVAYQAIVTPRKPRIAFYVQRIAQETKLWSWRAANLDFVLENRGRELRNIRIKSEPDFIGWRNMGDKTVPPKSTSEYFKDTIPYLGENEKRQFYWCEMEANRVVINKPFEITIEFDNPVLPFPRRREQKFKFDFSATYGVLHGINVRYDVHNVAEETTRVREELEKLTRVLEKIGVELIQTSIRNEEKS